MADSRIGIGIDADTSPEDAALRTRQWVVEHVPAAWCEAAERGGRAAIRQVRSRQDYGKWYPVLAEVGLVVPTWPVAYGGLDVSPVVARAIEADLAPFNLGRLNPLGLNLAAPALFAHGTEEQRLRFLPRIVANTERWCQLFSEPGAGSDLASLATRAERDGDEWVLTGQKVWTTWAHVSDFGVCLARTDPEVPKCRGITYFLVDLHATGVTVRPLPHITGEIDFNEVFLDQVRVPDVHRVGDVGIGWKVANATLSGERQMVLGLGLGRCRSHRWIGNAAADRVGPPAPPLARPGRPPVVDAYRQRGHGARLDQPARPCRAQGGRPPGPASSVGKVHQGGRNQRIQLLATDLLGPARPPGRATARANTSRCPTRSRGMLRSRANTIEGGTTEVNKNIIGERFLGLPREPDRYGDAAWREVPRS